MLEMPKYTLRIGVHLDTYSECVLPMYAGVPVACTGSGTTVTSALVQVYCTCTGTVY